MPDAYVDDLMSEPVETVERDVTLQSAARTLLERNVGALVVVAESGAAVGLVTATDFVRLASDGVASGDVAVAEYMRTDLVTTTRGALASAVAREMVDRRIHHVPVLEDDEPVGMLTTTDLTAYLAE
jgi:signal-transduction protein with cAMP-binding, CBS, and nucleotidyltransferase domain